MTLDSLTSRRFIACSVLLLCTPVFATDNDVRQLDDITVTSDLRGDTSADELATSISVIDEETLQAVTEQHFEELIEYVPNLNYSSATSRARYFQIRGIGERSQYEGAPNPSVGFLVDDIDFSGIGTAATLFDVEQVEVLRGPQGTRYGANALAGLIYVKSRDPEFDSSFRLSSLIGDDGDRSAGFSATGAINEASTAAYRFSLQQYRADGFRFNDFFNSDDTNERDELVSRAKFRFLPSDRATLDLTLLYADLDNGFDTFNPENTFVTHADDPGRDSQQSTGASARFSLRGDHHDLLSITSLADSDILYSFDGDWGNDEYFGEFAPYDFTARNDRQRKTLSQEIRLLSNASSRLFNDRTDWLAGIYALKLEEDNQFEDFFNDFLFRDLQSDYEATSLALFGQLDSALTDDLVLTTGIRVERRSADYRDTSGLDLSPTDTMVGGQISLRKSLASGQQLYTTLSRGYKAGGFNLGIELPAERREFEPEYLWNLEAGIKGLGMNGRLHSALSVFYARREDMQVSTSFQADPTDPLTFLFFTDNAASGENYGIELDARYLASRNITLYGSLGVLKASFRDFVTAERDLTDRDQAHAPGYQFALGMEYFSDNGLFTRVDVTGRDDFFFSNSHDQQSDAYHLVNLKAGYRADAWSVHLFANNLMDEEYATRGFFFGNEPPDFPNRLYTQFGNPRHIGIQAEISF